MYVTAARVKIYFYPPGDLVELAILSSFGLFQLKLPQKFSSMQQTHVPLKACLFVLSVYVEYHFPQLIELCFSGGFYISSMLILLKLFVFMKIFSLVIHWEFTGVLFPPDMR